MTYLDYNATTPVDPIVMDTMIPFFAESFGNPSSVHHIAGTKASDAIEGARKQAAQTVGIDVDGKSACVPKERAVCITSCLS